MPNDWKKLAVPLGILVPTILVLVGAYGWATSTFALASDVAATIQSIQLSQRAMEVRGLERDKRKVELEIVKLKAKRTYSSKKFDDVDKATLDAYQGNVQELKVEIDAIKRGKPE